jgi:MFS family permease
VTKSSRAGLIALVFACNGLGIPGFLARIPERQRDLDLSEGQLGLVVAGMALGAMVASAFAGRLIERLGSRKVALGAAGSMASSLWLLGVAPSAPVLFVALMAVGGVDAVMDTAMNANGALYEHETSHSVMHRLHGAWSLGALTAGGVASLAAGLDLPVSVHLALMGGLIGVFILIARPGLPPGRVVHDQEAIGSSAPAGAVGAADAGAGGAGGEVVDPDAVRPGRIVKRSWMRGVAVLAGATVAGAMLEGVPFDWAAVRIEQFDVASWVPALGMATFMAGMFAGRLMGDHLTDRYGRAEVLRAGTALGAAGFALGVFVPHPVTFIGGLLVSGAGVSAFFPLAFSAASRTPGVAPGVGAAVVSLSARIGFLVEPILVGALAEAVGLRWGFLLVAVLAVGVSVAAPRIVPRSSGPSGSGPGASRPPRAPQQASDLAAGAG